MASLVATAQTQPTIEEIIVTAQKRAERLIDVPSSITAVNAEQLTQENLTSIVDYYSRVPSLQYSCRQTYCLSLRGLTTGGATNPTLAVLIDDVQFGSTLQAGLGNSRFPDLDPSTLEGIEVLRGPQGTLYGAASLGGLIKYVTRRPQTDKFSARIETGMSTVEDGSEGWNVRGAVNLPFAGDRAALSVSAFNREDPAYMDNVRAGFAGKDVNETHTYGGRAALLFKVTDNLTVTLSALRQKRDAEFEARVEVLPTTPVGAAPNYQPRYGENRINLAGTTDVGNQELYTGRIEWDLGAVQVTSITAWGESFGTSVQDVSNVFAFLRGFYGAPAGSIVDIDDTGGAKKFSQELRFGGTAGALDWRTGVLYTKEDGTIDQTLTLFDAGGNQLAVPYVGTGPMIYKEGAVFADATYHLNAKWDLQAGVRYARNEQSNGSITSIDSPAQRAFGPSTALPEVESKDHALTWAISPTYHINPDLMAYFRAASGYRPGGPNTTAGDIPPTYDHDTVINYEFGLKGFAMSQTVSFDVAAFQIDWKDIQLQNTDAETQFTYFTNGGKARTRGLEGAIDWRPADGLSVGLNAAVLDAELTEALPVLATADSLIGADGDRLPGSAKFSGNLSVQQDFSLGSLDSYVGVNWGYIGARRSEFLNSASSGVRFEVPSYSQVDLRAGVSTESQWRIDLYARNFLNENGVVYADNRNGTNVTQVLFLQPRTYGITLSKGF
jgi:outer membrane receptor protein involved in Fe transport